MKTSQLAFGIAFSFYLPAAFAGCVGSPDSCSSFFSSTSCASSSSCASRLDSCNRPGCRQAGCGCRYSVGAGTSGRVRCFGTPDRCSRHDDDPSTCRTAGCSWQNEEASGPPTPTGPPPTASPTAFIATGDCLEFETTSTPFSHNDNGELHVFPGTVYGAFTGEC